MISKIKFPAIDLSLENDDWENMIEVFIENEYCYLSSNKEFEESYMNHILVDCKGNLYKIVGKENLAKWRRYFPFIRKSKLILKDLKIKMPLNEIKEYYIKKIRFYGGDGQEMSKKHNLYIDSLVEEVKKIKTINEFFEKYV